MVRPSKEVLGELLRLRNNQVLMGWFKESLDKLKEEAVFVADDTALRQVQGKAQVLSEILALVSRAEKKE